MKISTKIKKAAIGTFTGLSLMAGCSSIYTIDETEQAVVTKFGRPTEIIIGTDAEGGIDSTLLVELNEWNSKQKNKVKISHGAGVHTKTPFFEGVTVFEDRLLEYDSSPTEVVTKDKKHLFLDNYARWRIQNPLKFMTTVQTENGAQTRLDDIIYSVVREYAGKNNLIELVRSTNNLEQTTEKSEFEYIVKGREEIMNEITAMCNEKAIDYGIEIVDVRIKRADLPKENANSVYNRMREERRRMASKYRSEGEEQRIKITAETDRQKTEIMSESYRKAELIRGQGDAEALGIYAKAYSKNPEFYRMWQTLESYPSALDGTKVILSTETDFTKYIEGPKK